jgi:hypothetical protein
MTPGTITNTHFVIPAKAGIRHPKLKFIPPVMPPRLRGGDECFVYEVGGQE